MQRLSILNHIVHHTSHRRSIILPPLGSVYTAIGAVRDVVERGGDVLAAVSPTDAQRQLRATCALVTAHQEHLQKKGLLRDAEAALCSLFIQNALQWTVPDFLQDVEDEEKEKEKEKEDQNNSKGWLEHTLSAVSTTAKQGSLVLDTSVRTMSGFETKMMKIATHRSGLQFVMDCLGTHSQVQNHNLLQEVLVATAKSHNILKTTVSVHPVARRRMSSNAAPTLQIAWLTDWPTDRIGSWDLKLEGRTSGEYTIVTDLEPSTREFEFVPPVRNKMFEALKNSKVSSSVGFRIVCLPRTKGAVVEEDDGSIPSATSKSFGLGETFERTW